jgi:hypothetical protein
MPSMLVAYDRSDDSDSAGGYSALIDRIQNYKNWAQVHGSVWIVRSSDTADSVRDDLLRFLRPGDRLFVASLNQAAWHEPMCEPDWLRRHI